MTEQDNIASLIARLLKEESNCASVHIIDNAIECIKQLRKERDDAQVDQRLIEELWERRTDASKANARIQQLLGNTEQLEKTVARLTEDLRKMDAVINIVYVGIEKRKLRDEADYNNHQCRTTDGE